MIGIIYVLSVFIFLFPAGEAKSQSSDTLGCSTHVKVDTASRGVMIYPITPDTDYAYARPKTFAFLTNSLVDMKLYCINAFQKKNLVGIGLLAAGTAVLLVYDQQIVDEAQRLARRWHIPSDNKTKTIAHIGKFPIFVPGSLGSALYYLGDGSMHFLIAGSFFTYGLIAKDNRALETTSQLAEGMIAVGTMTQIIKHITGHETPARATVPGGKWRPFPNQIEYLKHVSVYDAFPSGHLASAMVCVTVIAGNYSEHKYIRPLGYTVMTVLGFQMLNNGVHWVSDYPLAIAMGYSIGKLALARGRKVIDRMATGAGSGKTGLVKSLNLRPFILGDDGFGIALDCEL